MKRILTAATLFLFFQIAFSQEVITERVYDILVEGENLTSSEFIIVRSGLSVGMKLTSDDVKQAIKNLYATGFYYQIEVEPSSGQYGTSLMIKVKENGRIGKIILKGNKKIKEKEILDSLEVQSGEFLSEYARFKVTNGIKDYYHKKGFLNVEITDSIGDVSDDNSVNLYYWIKENESVRIKKIEIFGNFKITDNKIKSMMKTKEKGFLQDGLFKENDFEEDKKIILAAIMDNGYPDATLDSTVFKYSYDNKFMFINIYVTQNQRFIFGETTFAGNTVAGDREIERRIAFKKNMPFSKTLLDKSISAIYEYYMDRGYIHVNVRNENERAGDTMKVKLNITENSLAYINDIIIEGNEKTEDAVIRREIISKPGEVFKRNDLVLSHSNLFRSGFFEDVQINPIPTDDPSKIDLTFKVKEKQTGEFNIGGSYNQADGLTGNVTIKITNLLGKGLVTSLLVEKGASVTNFSFGFTEPYLMGYPVMAGSEIYYKTSDKTYYYDQRIGGSVTTGLLLSERLMTKFYTKYKLEQVYTYVDTLYEDLLDSLILSQLGEKEMLSEISPYLVRDSRNHSFFPESGQMMGLYTSFAGGILGGGKDYFKITTDLRFYQHLFWKFTFMGRAAFGVVDSYDDPNNVPFTERFVFGGVGTWGIRGYPDRSIGSDIDGYVIGGRGAVLSNLELRLKLNEQAYMLMFYDVGNAYENMTEALSDRFKTLYHGTGVGVRIEIPMVGVMGIDLGYGFQKTPNGYGMNWEPHFQVGTSF
ncbi:MAG: outer membrane protein assembly factor BamA [bacterium]|nr:outer membrane protein assembly factor BamA [bacterium]